MGYEGERHEASADSKYAAHHWLPGRLRIERGTFTDYRRLEHFHYAPGRPAAPVGVWRGVYEDLRLPIVPLRGLNRGDLQLKGEADEEARRDLLLNRKLQIASVEPAQRDNCKSAARVIAVAVLAFPTPCSRARERTLHLAGPRYGPKLAFVNRHVRTIARVIVHPQFRSLGVAARLVRRICEDCPTRYVEAFAAMGDVHPFFERGGMQRVPGGEGEAAYFIFDRDEGGLHGK